MCKQRRLHDCRELHNYGLALPNLGDIDVQALPERYRPQRTAQGLALAISPPTSLR